MTDAVADYLQAHAGEARALLERLCRQPSIAAQGVGGNAPTSSPMAL